MHVTELSGAQPEDVSAPAFDSSGRELVATVDNANRSLSTPATLTLAAINPSGQETAVIASAQVPQSACLTSAVGVELKLAVGSDGRPYVSCWLSLWTVSGSSLMFGSQTMPTTTLGPLTFGAVVNNGFYPSFQDDAISYDGGEDFTGTGFGFQPVAGSQNYLVADRLASQGGGYELLARDGTTFVETGVSVPCPNVAQEPEGLIAMCPTGFQLDSTPVPSAPAATAEGTPSATSAAGLARENYYRAQAGLPPYTDDALIAQAALNHSLYWTLQPSIPDSLALHGETPGLPGYTGVDMTGRCQAAGAAPDCDMEDMDPEQTTAAGAVDRLMDTIYHREAILDATGGTAGVGQTGDGPWVLDFADGYVVNLAGAPYPNGNYSGPLDFECDSELPAPCTGGDVGEPISYDPPYQTTVTNMTLSAAGKQLQTAAGCMSCGQQGLALSSYSWLIPAQPLSAGTTYTVNVTYEQQGVTQGPSMSASWTFTTSGSSNGGDNLGSDNGGNSGGHGKKRHPAWRISKPQTHGGTLTVNGKLTRGQGAISAVAADGGKRVSLKVSRHGAAFTLSAKLPKRGRWTVTVRLAGRGAWGNLKRMFRVGR